MTPSRIAAIAAIILGVLALAFVTLRGGEADHYTLVFEDAGGLIKGNLVKVNGETMGTVSSIGVTKDLKAKVGIEVNELGPLRKGTLAQIRAASLGGVANHYVALSLAPNNAPALPEGSVIGTNQTTGLVSQDQLVNAFDPKTRAGIQALVKGQAQIVDGNSENLKKVLENAPGTLGAVDKFVKDLNPDDQSLRDIVVNAAQIDSALADRSAAIERLTRNAGIASEAIAGNGTEITQTLQRAPQTLDEATTVLNKLPNTLKDVQALLDKASANRAGVPETLNKLRSTLDSGSTTITSLANALNKPGKNNDAADLLDAAVGVGSAATKASKTVPAGLSAATPLLSKTRAYTPDILAAINNLGLASANYDAAGHYLRLSPVLNIFQLSGADGSGNQDLIPRSSFNNRLQGYTTAINRCPGSAAQATSDGSAPYTDNGAIACDTTAVPPSK
ncbi:MAG: MlaD family protein [Solirubrobacteraceae bacterium]|nr:MlaD family protein [Patulibacter sp.]